MLDSKNFSLVLNNLDSQDEELITVLDQIIKYSVNLFKNSEELREEIIDYNEVYQIFITDLNHNFWFRVSRGSIIYKKGINRSATFKVKYTRDIILKILKREISGIDAYMKGILKVDGDLIEGLRFTRLFRLVFNYIYEEFKKK